MARKSGKRDTAATKVAPGRQRARAVGAAATRQGQAVARRTAPANEPTETERSPAKVVTAPAAPAHARPGRNEPCHCGSGRKYKHCCLEKDEGAAAAARAKAAAEASVSAPEASASPVHTPKHQTHQPWKARISRGFIPRTRIPRKVGGG